MARRNPLVLAFGLALLVAGWNVANAQQQPQYQTPLDALQTEQGFGTVVLAASLAGLAANLSDPTLQAIILAPNDDAFTATLTAFPGATQFATGGPASLVLQYHMIPTTTPNAQLNVTDGQTLSTLLSSYNNATFQAGTLTNLTFKTSASGQTYVAAVPPGATLNLSRSITAGRSRIYTLSGGLLVPPSKVLTVFADPNNLTLAEALSNSDQFSLINQLVQADSVLKAFVENPDQAVTLFAPTNDAVNAALQALGVTAGDLAGSATARRIVLNHIIPSRPYASSELPQGSTTLASASSVAADSLVVTYDGTSVTVKGAGNTSPINVVFPNIVGGKSAVHGISGVILPSSSNSTTATPPPAAAGPPPAATPPPPPAATTIVEALRNLGLNSLVTTIQIANLTSDLSDPTLAVTLLAPSNAAFQAALDTYPLARSAITNESVAAVVLGYHVVPTGALPPLTDGLTLPTLLSVNVPEQANNSLFNVTFKPEANSAVYVGGLAPGATFNLTNATTVGNSTIYVIDGLLVPPSKALLGPSFPLTLLQALNATPTLSILATIIRSDPALLSFVSNPDQAVTVFAPTDDVFQAFAQAQNVTLASLLGTSLAQRIVLNHIIPSRPYTSRAIPATTATGPITLPSAQSGDLLNITSTGGATPNITVQGGGNASPIQVVAANVTAGKSVVHLVNGVILPNTAAPSTVPGPPGSGINTQAPGASPVSSPPPPPPGAATQARSSAYTVVLAALFGAALLAMV